jgi:hypothetical protein
MRGTLSGTLATMGCGVPYAVGAKYAHPERPAYALVGDSAMQMNGINELVTIAKYRRDWDDPRLVVAVLHNNDLNQVTWELRAMGGSPQSGTRQWLQRGGVDGDLAPFPRHVLDSAPRKVPGVAMHEAYEYPDKPGSLFRAPVVAEHRSCVPVRDDQTFDEELGAHAAHSLAGREPHVVDMTDGSAVLRGDPGPQQIAESAPMPGVTRAHELLRAGVR